MYISSVYYFRPINSFAQYLGIHDCETYIFDGVVPLLAVIHEAGFSNLDLSLLICIYARKWSKWDGKCTRVSLLETKREPAVTYRVAIMQSTLSTTLNDSV